jgi:16S rRNA (cytosine1402-N4)-methyltransferase
MKGATTQTTAESLTMRSLPTGSAIVETSALFAENPPSPHSSESVGGLQMATDFSHRPALVRETVSVFITVPAGVVIDGTVGAGGHSAAILDARDDLIVLGIDRDPAARRAASETLERFGGRARVVAGEFGDVAAIAVANGGFFGDRPIVGVLLDLGVSSPQLDDPLRGFSYRHDAPLDMRMDQSHGETASEWLMRVSEDDLVDLLRRHGESRFARSIAKSIKARSPQRTLELADAVDAAVPKSARRRGHVAARTFQAIRVEVNSEESQLADALDAAIGLLSPGGALVVISYHSGEDKFVKETLRRHASGDCTCPPGLPCVCGARARLRLLKASATLARPDEIADNPRARSARLRAGWAVSP